MTDVKAHKWLPELRDMGLLVNGEKNRRCTVTGRLAMTWFFVEPRLAE